MAISAGDIEKIAHLARIRIAPEHVDEAARRIGDIIAMVDQMQAVDTRDVAPMANPHDAHQRLRADEVTETNQRDRFQQLAPLTEDGLYLVPKVID